MERVKTHREMALEMADAQLWHSDLKLTEKNAATVGRAVVGLADIYLDFLVGKEDVNEPDSAE